VRTAATSVAAAVLATAVISVSAQQSPTFRSGVNLLAVDALVIDRDGQPITGLTAADFTVRINNQLRKIVSADLVRHTTVESKATLPAGASSPAAGTAPPALIRTPGQIVENTRTIVIAIDEPSFLPEQIKPAVRAVQAFIRKLDPNDVVGVYVYPFAKAELDMTHDHAAAIEKLDKTMGRRDRNPSMYNLTASDILDITAGDADALRMVILRECAPDDPICPIAIRGDAMSIGAMYEIEGARRVVGISELIYSLGALPGHKTLVVLSAGMMSATKPTGRPDFRSYMTRLGEQAARANVQPYFIHMDNSFEELMAANRPSGGRRPDLRVRSALFDAGAWASGLERMAGESGGVYMQWKAGTGELVFDRLLRETSAYYLLGVEPTEKDWDGRTLLVNVKTTVKGATVRALRQVIAR
jgi:VWFA-related protein